jgi:hypothetical protein
MDIETFNKGFKLFTRFIKNENVYMPVKKLMFKNGRKKESLFNEFNSKKFSDVDDWGLVFSRVNLLTAYRWPIDQEEFYDVVLKNNLIEKWKKFYYNNK